MAKRKTYLMRIHPDILKAMQYWANDEIRSLNAQIEFVMRKALRDAGRIKINKPEKNIVGEKPDGVENPVDNDKNE